MKLKSVFTGRNIYCFVSIAVFAAMIIIGSVIIGPKITQAVRDPESFREFLGTNKIKSYLIFIGIQFVQIIFAFIPGEFIEVAAGYVYGGFKGMILCVIGAFAASCVIFKFTRIMGNKFTSIMIDSRNLKRLKFLQNEKKLEIFFAVLYFIPGTPKDLLTYFAGVTKIRFKIFMLISTFCRIPSVISSTYAGSALGEKQYLRSVIIFAVTGAIGICGYLLYQFLSKHHEKKHGKSQEGTKT